MNAETSQKLQAGAGVISSVLSCSHRPRFQLSHEMDLRCAEMQQNFESKKR